MRTPGKPVRLPWRCPMANRSGTGFGRGFADAPSGPFPARTPFAGSRSRFPLGLGLMLWLSTVCGAETRGALLLLLREPPALMTALRAAKETHVDDRDARRAALTALRRAAYAEGAPALESALAAMLPPDVSYEIEALPALYGLLLHVPLATAETVARRLRAPGTAALPSLASVSLHPGIARPPPAGTRAATKRTDGEGLVLAIFDRGVDPTHPWLRAAFGEIAIRPGALPARAPSALLRSHGTAMLGIYAQVARGRPLRALGVEVLAAGPAFRFAAAMAASAGPETAAGRTALARNLAWLAEADAPVPDILNYSQGNGPLCVGQTDCAAPAWHGVTRLLDRLAEELDVLVVKSAGNAGFAPGGSLTVPADSFNGLVVGNMFAFDRHTCRPSADRSQHHVYRTSSVAPAPEVAPRLLDLVAPGVRIATAGVDPAYCLARCGGARGPPCAFCPRLGRPRARRGGFYKDNTGTSPAAAVAGAVAARLLHAGPRDPLRAKAVLINSASTWTSGGQPHPLVPQSGDCPSLPEPPGHVPWRFGSRYDRTYGWGYLDAAAAAAQAPYARRDALAPGETRCYRATLAPWDKVTLVWQRRVGSCAGCSGDGAFALSPLVLELRVPDHGFAVLDRDTQADPADNVQQVSNGRGPAANPRRREVEIVVRLSATAIDGADGEPYALAAPAPLTRLAACSPASAPAGPLLAPKFTAAWPDRARRP